MTEQALLKLSAEYVPPDVMQAVRWFVPVRSGQLWYYFTERLRFFEGSTSTSLALVDPLLRPIIAALNERNIPTLPSCQGHFWDEDEFETLYVQLQLDEHIIRTSGLLVRDLETQQVLNYKDVHYTAPDKHNLKMRMLCDSGYGYFSFALPSLQGASTLLRTISNAGAQLTYNVVNHVVIVNVSLMTSAETQKEIWTEFSRQFVAALNELNLYIPTSTRLMAEIKQELKHVRPADVRRLSYLVFVVHSLVCVLLFLFSFYVSSSVLLLHFIRILAILVFLYNWMILRRRIYVTQDR